jgi:hypothetical protein
MLIVYIYIRVCPCVRACVFYDELPDGFVKGFFVKIEPQRRFPIFCLTACFLNNLWAIFKALINILYDTMCITEHLCKFFRHAEVLLLSNNKLACFWRFSCLLF